MISFTNNNILINGTGYQKSLHIAAISLRFVLGGVLIDGGSTLNIYTYDTLERISINHNRIHDNYIVVRAFDGSCRDMVGEIELPIESGPYTLNILFQVLNIMTSYNLLLGRP